MSRVTVAKAIDKLLDNGFLSINSHIPSGHGKYHRVYQVNHPDELENVRYAISMFPDPPSVRWKNWRKPTVKWNYTNYPQMREFWGKDYMPGDDVFSGVDAAFEARADYLID